MASRDLKIPTSQEKLCLLELIKIVVFWVKKHMYHIRWLPTRAEEFKPTDRDNNFFQNFGNNLLWNYTTSWPWKHSI
jgi:hypothetical protein